MQAENIRNICVIGAGFIGPGIAQIFAAKGYNVCLMDVRDEILIRVKGKSVGGGV